MLNSTKPNVIIYLYNLLFPIANCELVKVKKIYLYIYIAVHELKRESAI